MGIISKKGKDNQEFIYCACGCGIILTKYNIWGRARRFKQGHNFDKEVVIKPRYAEHNPAYKNGKTIINGYIAVLSPNHPFKDKNNRVYEHRLVYEQFYNCILLPSTLIHHINGNKLDNRIENLKPTTRSEHCKIHFKKSHIN